MDWTECRVSIENINWRPFQQRVIWIHGQWLRYGQDEIERYWDGYTYIQQGYVTIISWALASPSPRDQPMIDRQQITAGNWRHRVESGDWSGSLLPALSVSWWRLVVIRMFGSPPCSDYWWWISSDDRANTITTNLHIVTIKHISGGSKIAQT